ncbi:YiiX/YebB-like N1pC/P60 family cysteine hydrolase [Leptospira levettii]|uniref:YiiX/YebB-like N1pC/P60 family cysteine hydrolase n=1 Tax=Leptospira levettii TaxID=2023178 RepID=UPI001083B857|nr:YiiX/YebB-like N1pC/P60 family cysteine hydrolase [Leptospira levettii]TGL10274.1 hypothetical protein EHQ39_08555 [Leptospira levettii]
MKILLKKSDLVLLKLKHGHRPKGINDENEIGVYLGEEIILYRNKKKFYKENILTLEKNIISVMTTSRKFPQLAEFLDQNKDYYRTFELGLGATCEKYDERILNYPNFVPEKNISNENFELLWDCIWEKIQPGDLIFTRTEDSWLSKCIANFDLGYWSHVGTIIDSEHLIEATTKGVIQSKISDYKKKNVRIGIYRMLNYNQETIERLLSFAKSTVGAKYNYKGVLKLFIKKSLNLKLRARELSPNDLCFSGNFYPIHLI